MNRYLYKPHGKSRSSTVLVPCPSSQGASHALVITGYGLVSIARSRLIHARCTTNMIILPKYFQSMFGDADQLVAACSQSPSVRGSFATERLALWHLSSHKPPASGNSMTAPGTCSRPAAASRSSALAGHWHLHGGVPVALASAKCAAAAAVTAATGSGSSHCTGSCHWQQLAGSYSAGGAAPHHGGIPSPSYMMGRAGSLSSPVSGSGSLALSSRRRAAAGRRRNSAALMLPGGLPAPVEADHREATAATARFQVVDAPWHGRRRPRAGGDLPMRFL
jgi:hypothetical protein